MISIKWLQIKSGKLILLISTLFLLLVAILFVIKPFIFSIFLEYVYFDFNGINFATVAGLVSNITFVLLGIIVPIFVFTVTLIGNAARLAKEQQSSTEQKNKEEFDNEVKELNKKLKEIGPEDLAKLKEQINNLEIKKRYTEDKIKKIEIKYASLGLTNSVIIPGTYLIISLILNKWLISFNENYFW